MRIPWEILVGVVIFVLSFVPTWMIDLQNAPVESDLRFLTTALVAALLLAILNKMSLARWILLVLLVTGAVVSIWSFVVASTVEGMSTIITIAQAIGMSMFFMPAASRWFRKPAPDKESSNS